MERTKAKDSFTLRVSDSSANIQATFNPPIYLEANRNYEMAYLEANRNYEMAMVNLEMYYSFANIREGDNNSSKWSVDDGTTWKTLRCYELNAINAEIIRIRGNTNITILPNISTLQRILTVVGQKV